MSFDRINDLMQLTSCDKLSTSNSIVPSPQHSTSRIISSLQHPMCNLDLWFPSKGSSSNQDSAIDVSQKTKVAIEAALMAQQLGKYEIQMRKNVEMKAIHEVGERKKAMDALACSEIRYRKYPIKEIEVATDYFSNSLKIGEGGYGPVYKAFLDHTPVAIKITGNFPAVIKALLSVSSCLQDNPRAEAVNSTTPGSSGMALHGTGTENIRANHMMVMEEEVVFKLLCQVDKVGSLIGKGGSIIRALQN
ncbi:U-box domain-containing protein 34 [Camellia lanceoleosa]|uniref:U-box domain-containing protein 34 n=1 Tax=Camellia lanceoleosa TaxID=1840588 RepID=A0ACC0I634_9ERIC|nr:U-box domain-containing protein 34 [Camellia lanceoleosa]